MDLLAGCGSEPDQDCTPTPTCCKLTCKWCQPASLAFNPERRQPEHCCPKEVLQAHAVLVALAQSARCSSRAGAQAACAPALQLRNALRASTTSTALASCTAYLTAEHTMHAHGAAVIAISSSSLRRHCLLRRAKPTCGEPQTT